MVVMGCCGLTCPLTLRAACCPHSGRKWTYLCHSDTQVDTGRLGNHPDGTGGSFNLEKRPLFLLRMSHFPGAWRDGQAVLIFKPHVLNAY